MRATALLVCFTSALASAATPLERAQRAHDALEYEECLQALGAADLTQPVGEQVQWLFVRARCAFPLGRISEAMADLQTAVALDPDAELPPFTSPKLKKAHAELAERARAARAAQQAVVTEPPPPAPPIDAPVKRELEPLLPAPPPLLAAAEHPLKKHAVAVALGGTALVGLGVGAGFGLAAQDSQQRARAAEFQSDALAWGTRAKTEAMVANVAFISAGAVAVGALVTFLARAW